MSLSENVYLTGVRAPIDTLDRLPFPDRSYVDYEKYNNYIGQSMVKDCISLQATRGCPFKCYYCHKIWPKTHFVRSAENIFDEVKLFYDMGVTRFAFVDDIFNFDKRNSTRFYQLLIKHGLKVQLYFPNGLRGDILTKDYIDLMVEAGTVDIAFALETGSPRMQKLIRKHLDIDKLRENIQYTYDTYPEVILELQTMFGFPTETEEEALMTFDFIFSLKWLDFPYLNILKIFTNTDMEKLAIENGVSIEDIGKSRDLTYDELPSTLPYEKDFVYKLQTRFLHEYFLSRDRLASVLPHQMRLFTEDELLQKYNSYMPGQLRSIPDLLNTAGFDEQEMKMGNCLPENVHYVPDLNRKIRDHFVNGKAEPASDALRVLLLDLSLFFRDGRDVLYDVVEPPLGLIYLLSYLEQQRGSRVLGKIAKSRIDFENYEELKGMLASFKPDVIGIRTLSLFKNFFHETVARIREWGFEGPVIAGGPYGTSDYRLILEDPGVDVAVLGEGEVTFDSLVAGIMENNGKLPEDGVLETIQGLAFVPGRGNRREPVRELSRQICAEQLNRFNVDLEDE